VSYRLRVNPITCEAHGMCAELLPERISLDEWGYPLLGEEPLDPVLVDHARCAWVSSPPFALLLHPARQR
jgi:ferredoxin